MKDFDKWALRHAHKDPDMERTRRLDLDSEVDFEKFMRSCPERFVQEAVNENADYEILKRWYDNEQTR